MHAAKPLHSPPASPPGEGGMAGEFIKPYFIRLKSGSKYPKKGILSIFLKPFARPELSERLLTI